MTHFAKLDNTGTVTKVIVAEQDFINSGAVGDSFLWVQTSYSGNFRKNYAGIGFTYDKTQTTSDKGWWETNTGAEFGQHSWVRLTPTPNNGRLSNANHH